MLEGVRRRYLDLWRRLRRYERRNRRQFRRWVETTSNLTHLSVLLFVPLLIAVVTWLSNSVAQLSFLLFPPLASGTYTLFADPEGAYSSARSFVGGMTVGALCGWLTLAFSATFLYHVPPARFEVHTGAAALSVLFTGLVAWALDVENPTAYSTALLVIVTETSQFAYVLSVLLASTLVAAVFALWRGEFYEERARFLYRTMGADDRVLVPLRGEGGAETATAMFGGRLAAAHDAGKLVLLDVVDDEEVAASRRAVLGDDGASDAGPDEGMDGDATDVRNDAEAKVASDAARTLEAHAARVRTELGVPCEVAVAVDGADPAATVEETAREANCDLIVVPYEEAHGGLSPFVRDLLRLDFDVVVFRSVTERTRWKRVLVPVRRASDVAHAMIDYAERLASPTGSVSVCTCIGAESQRRPTESMLADLAETVSVRCETRVSRMDIAAFLERNDSHYDLVLIGASTNRSAASRFLSPPTFQRIKRVETDVAIVHVS